MTGSGPSAGGGRDAGGDWNMRDGASIGIGGLSADGARSDDAMQGPASFVVAGGWVPTLPPRSAAAFTQAEVHAS